MTKALRLIGYARCSTTEQATSGLGIDAQRAAIDAAVERNGWSLVQVVVDGGESGAQLDRPGLQRALGMIASGTADGLVAAKLDRVSRSVVDFATLLSWFADARASLVILDPAMDTTTPSGRLVANVFASVAEWERDTIAGRTRDSLAALRASGRAISRPAVEDHGELAQRIQALRAAGATLQAIADTLNAEGVPTLRGGAQWRPSSVQAATGYRRPPTQRRPTNLPPVPRRRTRRAEATTSQ